MELYLEHERFQTEQRQRHLARQSRKARSLCPGAPQGWHAVSCHRPSPSCACVQQCKEQCGAINPEASKHWQ
jgi:hypothetical protein